MITLLTAIALGGAARAQDTATIDDTFDFELFHPHADFYGYGATQGAATLTNLQLGVGAWFNYSNDPVVLLGADGTRVSPAGTPIEEEAGNGVVDGRATTNLQIGMGFTRFASLTVDLPLVMSQRSWSLAAIDDPTATAEAGGGGGLGDLQLTPKVALLDRDYMPVGLALLVPVRVPSGSARDYLGEGGVSFAPALAFEYSDASVHTRQYTWRAALNGGYRIRNDARLRDVRVGNAFTWAAAFGLHPIEKLEVTAELHGESFGATAVQSPAEMLVGGKVLLSNAVALNLAGGSAITSGVGAPDYRIIAGVAVAPSFDPDARDSDRDKIPDGRDRCAKDPEDYDGFQDEDGCPELDNDADGREDGVDKCPNDPEDDDGYLDNDGCPDPDNDKDGVVDVQDKCPDEAETKNGKDDEDGCPDGGDSDGDGMEDDVDRCPYDPEDKNNFEDEDGCPDERLKNARVVVTAEAIKIKEVIFFDTGKATIQSRSFDLLDELARVIVEHPEIKKIRVEGHTDNVGNELSNLKLSQARAESVVTYLKGKGVDGSRLDAAGFGQMRPIASNATEDGRSQNRRVEFIIVDRD